MATSLLKLTMTATAPTTKANPTTLRYFNTAPTGGYTGSATYTIDDVNWLNDAGVTVSEHGLVPAATDNGSYLLFINGELQEGNVVTGVTIDDVTITFGESTDIDEGKILALVVSNFGPTTTAPDITG
ncbi:DUF4183 domain-containing protein [Papillibacter cinnamivorans]|uniref:Uncharacterized protein n=1 Tax=Papillibacter cinnamivorans DSM 12816 TaxID=1122930 RepID=A0A1W2C1R8_9FIRM|nr:DUF4183 domain-containing protein [Papillibacter cinnamivorans]SMC78852.1 protein of unknown function [Papillibacter cinnamivorans DSM 12816]